ncbi:hypothetical protein MBLNU457_g0090t2 [Dothideomycetes sp. NU457]
MHIKTISIQGFKSYRTQTNVEEFSPGHNVVVGRNGSGKSNFFAAIRFVLGDAYTQMGREERQALLHEGQGSAVMTAFVEIIFDNTDRRFPNGSDELILRRTIGQKKDEYSLDRKNATKTDVMNMLESAGFSKANPYYIVPQGRVTALTNMKDHDRLNLLKEVAGTHVYENRRQESRKIIEETQAKREKIDDVLSFINERLTELEEEKEELKGFQEKDREKRCLEYTIYLRDQEDANRKLAELEDLQQNGAEVTDHNREEFLRREQQLEKIQRQLDELTQRIKFLDIDKKQFDDERKAAAREKAKIELEVKTLREGQSAAQQARDRHTTDLNQIQAQIEQRETELAQINPQYNAQKEEETKARAQLEEADGQRQRLYAKQGRQAQFRTKRERDDWLQAQVEDINMRLATRKAINMETEENLTTLHQQIEKLEGQVNDLRDRIDNRGDESQNMAAEVQKAVDERDRLQDRRKELRREEAKLGTVISHAQQEVQKAERHLSQMMDHNTARGLAAVRRIVRQHNIEGVYGTLAELFEPHDAYRTAIEVTAGASLFHYIVDTDETAARILEIMQQEKAGRVTFVPLNRVRPKPANLPRANDAVPLISKLKYDARFEAAFQQVFGKTIVCPNLQIASQYARSHSVGAITPDGDRADKKGALTGGYHDQRKSRLDACKDVNKWRDDYDNQQERADEIRRACEKLDQEITRAISNLLKAEQKKEQSENGYGPLLKELRSKSNDLQTKRDELEKMQQTRQNAENNLQALGQQMNDYERELQSDFKKALTAQEERQLETLGSTVQDLRRQVNELAAARSDLEVRKRTIEVELRENLRPRIDQLHADDAELNNGREGTTSSSRLTQRQRDLKRADEALSAITAKLEDTDSKIEQAQTELQKRESTLAVQQQEIKDLSVQMYRQQKSLEKSASRRAMYVNQATDVAAKIRNLGVLPEAAFKAPYTKMSYDKALKSFHRVQEELKKYGQVNKKAFEQYNNNTNRRTELENRREELETSLRSITELIETLDQRKDEAIERTFRQVSKEFATIFEKLVPAGRGSLRIQRKADRAAEADGSDDEGDRHRSSVDNYTGVSIQVSFNSKHDEQQKIQQLSGGQKSLCALALVFAIQASDPAPFYLFDEIDANLDAQYRTAVAELLHESARDGQFICTTFRPEMLHVAEKTYAVGYDKKASSIGVVSREAALQFVEGQIGGK